MKTGSAGLMNGRCQACWALAEDPSGQIPHRKTNLGVISMTFFVRFYGFDESLGFNFILSINFFGAECTP